MPSDLIELIDWLVPQIQAYLSENYPSETYVVERVYAFEEDAGTVEGKLLRLFPSSYINQGPSTRKEDYFDCVITFVYVERWTGQGNPSVAWTDARVDVIATLFDELTNTALKYGSNNEYWPQYAEVSSVYDDEYYTEDKLFWSSFEVVYRKLRPSPAKGSF